MARDEASGAASRPGSLVDAGETEAALLLAPSCHGYPVRPPGDHRLARLRPRACGAYADRRGTSEASRPGSEPANVLFLVPPEGTRAYQNWEWCLGYLRLEQSRRWLVRQQVIEAEAELKSAEEELEEVRQRHERTGRSAPEGRATGAGRGARRDGSLRRPGRTPGSSRDWPRPGRTWRRVGSAERRRDRLRLRLAGLRDHLVPRVYPGSGPASTPSSTSKRSPWRAWRARSSGRFRGR